VAVSRLDECRVVGLSSKGILIRDCVFVSLTSIQEAQAEEYFCLCRNVISDPKKFSITYSNLCRAGFKGTDVSEISFIDNKWSVKPGQPVHILDDLLARNVLPPRTVDGPYGKVSFEECAETYRQLRKNFENKGNRIDAGQFYYGEMEIRRLSTPLYRRLFSLYSFYKILSSYGESPLRTFLVFSIVFVLLVLLQTLAGFTVGTEFIKYGFSGHGPFQFPSLTEIANAARLTFGNLALRNPDVIKPASDLANTSLWIFETVFGPIQLGLFALAVKRRFQR
jgi:hypothetical protein